MFRIRTLYDDLSLANNEAIDQVLLILGDQFPAARPQDFEKLRKQLHDPISYQYKTILLVAENTQGKVKGFAVLLHMPDINALVLELISTAAGQTGGGLGGVLYERVREEAESRGVDGLFFECSVDDPVIVRDPKLLAQNVSRLRFYERYGALPILHNLYSVPVDDEHQDLYYLMYDPLGHQHPLARKIVQSVARAILERKYADLVTPQEIDDVVQSFTDDPVVIREPRYVKAASREVVQLQRAKQAIALFVNRGHDIHHVRDRGYLEAPVRVPVIYDELEKTGLFMEQRPSKTPDKLIRRVHDARYVSYLKKACAKLPLGKSIYPIIFPVRNLDRPPKDIELQVGYYCTDTFTPLHHNAYPAARGAVDCAVSAAKSLFNGHDLAYALVRPPGHHAERRVWGGFCYLNNSAIAAEYLSDYGRVAVLDVDFHHGNGTQDIFYKRPDVYTVSIHGAPPDAYPFYAGFADEKGEGEGLGFNLNLPLPAQISVERYHKTLAMALKKIRAFKPDYLVIALGLDTANADPTGTWTLKAKDFHENGRLIGAMGMPTLIVQEGGYRTRTLGINARHFFEGLAAAHPALSLN